MYFGEMYKSGLRVTKDIVFQGMICLCNPEKKNHTNKKKPIAVLKSLLKASKRCFIGSLIKQPSRTNKGTKV
jgi:hypothetical protein